MKKLLLLFILTLATGLPIQAGGPTEKVTVGTSNISDGSITTSKLADGSITNTKVATGTFAELNGQAAEDFAVKDLNVSGVITQQTTATRVDAGEWTEAFHCLSTPGTYKVATLTATIDTRSGAFEFDIMIDRATGTTGRWRITTGAYNNGGTFTPYASATTEIYKTGTIAAPTIEWSIDGLSGTIKVLANQSSASYRVRTRYLTYLGTVTKIGSYSE